SRERGTGAKLFSSCAVVSIAAVLALPALALAADVKTAGKLAVPDRAPLFAVSTDPIVQQTLDQDFRGMHRGPNSASNGVAPVTITVTLTQRLLKPGTTLRDFGGGDLMVVAQLIKQAG